MDKLIIFTLNGCGHCSNLKKRLDDINIVYREVEITQNKEVWDEIVKQIKYDYLPTVLISPDDSQIGHIFVPSVHYQTEDKIVEIIQSYF